MAKSAKKLLHIVRVMEFIAEKQTKKLMDAAKKRYDRFEAQAKKAKTEEKKQRLLAQAYSGLILAGHAANMLKTQLDEIRGKYLVEKPKTAPSSSKKRKRRA